MSEAQIAEAGALPPPSGLPATDLDPYSRASILDPYPVHAALRELGPVAWLSRYNTCVATRYEAVSTVLMTPTDFLSSGGVGLSDIRKPGAWRVAGPLVEADPPQHGEIRGVMNRIFTPAAIKAWRDRFTATAHELCDTALAAGEIEIVEGMVEPYVFTALSGALGVELDRENIIVVGNHSFNSAGPRNEIYLASLSRAEAVSAWFEDKQKREAMIPGGFGEAVFLAEEAGDLPPGTAGAILRTLIRGGMDTTVSGLGTCLRLLAEHPDVWVAMKGDRSLAGAVFEEALRLESPTQTIYRTTAHDVAYQGLVIPADTKVQVIIGAANRDPRAFEAPDAFRPGLRPAQERHLAFGTGPHTCLGRVLARLEAECFLDTLRARVGRLKVAGRPAFRAVNALRTLDRMTMAFD